VAGAAWRWVEFRLEIGPVPRRDRSDGGALDRRDRESDISARGWHSCASPTTASSDSCRKARFDVLLECDQG